MCRAHKGEATLWNDDRHQGGRAAVVRRAAVTRGATAVRRAAVVLLLGTGLCLGVGLRFGAPPASAAPATGGQDGSLVMVLDSSGSMAGPDGSGSTRIASARTAVGAVVDSLPDGYPTGLRVYGAGKTHGCDDTSLVQPVTALDRAAMKRAVAAVRPKGDTPTALALTKAAADLPADGRRTILLVSDGESNCGAPKPCQVAAQLAGRRHRAADRHRRLPGQGRGHGTSWSASPAPGTAPTTTPRTPPRSAASSCAPRN